jgi:hypothetical protein
MSIQEFSAAANPEEDVGTIPRISRRRIVFFFFVVQTKIKKCYQLLDNLRQYVFHVKKNVIKSLSNLSLYNTSPSKLVCLI